jgi:hypothetical protein
LPERVGIVRRASDNHTGSPPGSSKEPPCTTRTSIGLGWRLDLARGIASEADGGPGGSASLIVGLSDNRAYVALTNRKVPILGLNRKVFQQGS